MRKTTLIVLSLFLVSGTQANAQTNTLRGKVREINGVTVNNAIVELRFGTGAMISQTVTRNEGDFAFTNLSGGEYEVAVAIAGYERAVQMVRFNQDDRAGFSEDLSIEVLIRPKRDTTLAPPGTSYAQEVPKPARAAFEKAITRLREGKSEEGVAGLRDAIVVFNDYFDAHYVLAKELFRTGKDKESLEALERARQINDRQDGVYYLFGLVMMKQGKYIVAEFAFREATRLNANNVWSRFYRGQALIELAVRTNDAEQRNTYLRAAEGDLNLAW
jgi:tetratricopeptide (TPR) repeat protein